MKRIVKTLALFTFSLALTSSLHAQLKLPFTSNIAPDIRKVIEDYPNHFNNLAGELIVQSPQSVDYECNFKVNGAEQASITKYTSKNNAVSSWQALMLTTESFDDAKKRFHSLYGQMNNMSVKNGASQNARLKGVYHTPSEEKKFTSVIFAFDSSDESLKKLRVELLMSYEPMEWKVKVLVYEKEREDDERGAVTEN